MSVYDQGALLEENRALKKANREIAKDRRALEAQIAFKESENQRLGHALAGELSLWKSRDDGWDAGKGPALHRMEVPDDIIHDGDKLRPATLADCNKFRYMLERAERFLAHSGQMPLFRDDAGRISDPGNRCKLYLRHALLMALIHKKDNPRGRKDRHGRPGSPHAGPRCMAFGFLRGNRGRSPRRIATGTGAGRLSGCRSTASAGGGRGTPLAAPISSAS